MLRLDYFLMRGGLVVKDDICLDVNGYVTEIETSLFASIWNKDEPENKSCYIESFTPRTNNGKQSMPDDFPIVATRVDGIGINRTAWQVRWGEGESHHTDIESWTPDLEKLLEQQREYDKAKAEHGVMISEKEMMIVDAVNEL